MATSTKSVRGNNHTEVQSVSSNKNQENLSTKTDMDKDISAQTDVSNKSGLNEKEHEAKL